MPTPTTGCTVVVRHDEARIVFPAVHRTIWTWNRANGGLPDYSWIVYLTMPGIELEVGREAHGPEQTGDLATMLSHATVAITWPSSGKSKSEFDEYRTVPSLHATVIDGRPALEVKDSALLHELFGLNHPPFADCRFYSAQRGEEDARGDSVRYVGSGPPPT